MYPDRELVSQERGLKSKSCHKVVKVEDPQGRFMSRRQAD